MNEARIGPEALDYIGFYDKPLPKLEHLLETYIPYARRGFRSFLQFLPLWAKQKLHLPREKARVSGVPAAERLHQERGTMQGEQPKGQNRIMEWKRKATAQ